MASEALRYTRNYPFVVWVEDRGERLYNQALVVPKGSEQEKALRESGRGRFVEGVDKEQILKLKWGKEVSLAGIPFFSGTLIEAFRKMPLVRIK